MPKIAPVAVVSFFEGVGGLACVGTVEDLLVLGLAVRLVVIAGGLAITRIKNLFLHTYVETDS